MPYSGGGGQLAAYLSTCIALTTESGGPTNFRLMQLFARFQQITEPSLLPVSTDNQPAIQRVLARPH